MTQRKTDDTVEAVRIDRWLWAARLYKTRSLAATAIRGGRVHLNGQRAKPSRTVAVGDRLEVSRDRQRQELIVRQLSGKRGPAPVAMKLYEETPASIEKRTLEALSRKSERAAAPSGRPDKKERREIKKFLRGHDD